MRCSKTHNMLENELARLEKAWGAGGAAPLCANTIDKLQKASYAVKISLSVMISFFISFMTSFLSFFLALFLSLLLVKNAPRQLPRQWCFRA